MEPMLATIAGLLNTPLTYFCLPFRFCVVDGHIALGFCRRHGGWELIDPSAALAVRLADRRIAEAQLEWNTWVARRGTPEGSRPRRND